jgi:hypothetical protein
LAQVSSADFDRAVDKLADHLGQTVEIVALVDLLHEASA